MHAVEAASGGVDTSDVYVLDDLQFAHTSPREQRASDSGLNQFHAKPWSMWSGALLLTMVVHSLLLGSLVLGSGTHRTRPPMKEGFSAVARNSDGSESVSVLLFFNDSSISSSDQDNESAYAASRAPEKISTSALALSAADVGSPPAPDIEIADNASAPEESAADGAQLVMLFGRYMGQVKARIERAWSYPVAPTKSSFHCRAQIKQSKQGEVEQITLQQCDADSLWQASLFQAIQAASPLSAPPSEKVFTEIVTLSFTAQAAPAPEKSARTVQLKN